VPGDLRKISLLAIVLLVLLRISIGWHLMYEGLWKLSTLRTPNPWSAEGYLKNSTGPLRDTFRNMTGDPNDLKWLDYDQMHARWEDWRERFLAHYPRTDQPNSKSNTPIREQLAKMMDGPESFTAPLQALPSGLDLAKVQGVAKGAIRYDAQAKLLIVDGKKHLLPVEKERLIDAAGKLKKSGTDDQTVYDGFVRAVNTVARAASRLSFYDRLTALLKEDPERVGRFDPIRKSGTASGDDAGADDSAKEYRVIVGDVDKYKNYLAFYEKQYAKARTKSEWNHLEKQWIEIQQLRRELVGPIQAIEQDLFSSAEELLDADQLATGPVAPPYSPVQSINQRTMWGLTIFGLLLMVGLCTRLSALGGAALLSMFYLAVPPWPGVQEIPSIEHNLIVNKVFVELVALLAIAALPTGKWFGIDAAVCALFTRRPPIQKR
jgi:uncharacterized membrane protein YphA (DoxX/SURF4 family)